MDFFSFLAWSPAPDGGQGGGGGMTSTIVMFAMIFGIFYFMVMRPQQKRMKEHQALLAAIKRGDEVVTSSGMHGKVHEVEEKTVLVEVAKNTVIRFDKAAGAARSRGRAPALI
jgi:preprotein translocase subunit YajC